MGPWRAAERFARALESQIASNSRSLRLSRIRIELFGSLAKTGVGHGTDFAVILGLEGVDPVTVDVLRVAEESQSVKTRTSINVNGRLEVSFDYSRDVCFHRDQVLDYHPNGLELVAELEPDGQERRKHATGRDRSAGSDGGDRSREPVGELSSPRSSAEERPSSTPFAFSRRYYSIGGGFVVEEGEEYSGGSRVDLPFPVDSAAQLLSWCRAEKSSVSEIVRRNMVRWHGEGVLRKGLQRISSTMLECVYNGIRADSVLPGGLGVHRRAPRLARSLLGEALPASADELLEMVRRQGMQVRVAEGGFEQVTRWVSCFALAVNEENAGFGRVVTAPTNGAAGVIPAVLLYYRCFFRDADEDGVERFLLTAGDIGSLFKKGATISAAMGGCQAEIGVSSAMAAAALTEAGGGTPEQVLQAAEIAMEHHLGMTCDPVGGLVQIPCIERNTMGAIKAITASNIALAGDPSHARVSLDQVIDTMWDTARDMNSRYKETSEGGLAVHIPINVIEC